MANLPESNTPAADPLTTSMRRSTSSGSSGPARAAHQNQSRIHKLLEHLAAGRRARPRSATARSFTAWQLLPSWAPVTQRQ